MRITINGSLGSGKSTVGRQLADFYKVPFYSTGGIFREIGQISSLDALQTNLAAENNVEIDYAVDEKIRELDRTQPDFVIDSRMAWHFVRNATNIFLSVMPDTAARRIIADQGRQSENYTDLFNALSSIRQRRESELKRYKRLYNVDIEDAANYDLFIITDDTSPENVVQIAKFFVESRGNKYWIPKARLVPMITIRDASGLTFTQRTELRNELPIPLAVDDNFGFYFSSAANLLLAFYYESDLIPYAIERPSFLGKQDLVSLAKKQLKPSDLYDWEDVAHTHFTFADRLVEKSAH